MKYGDVPSGWHGGKRWRCWQELEAITIMDSDFKLFVCPDSWQTFFNFSLFQIRIYFIVPMCRATANPAFMNSLLVAASNWFFFWSRCRASCVSQDKAEDDGNRECIKALAWLKRIELYLWPIGLRATVCVESVGKKSSTSVDYHPIDMSESSFSCF